MIIYDLVKAFFNFKNMKVKRTMRVLMIASYLKQLKSPTSFEVFAYNHSLKNYIWSFVK